jgi:hypothetical protein
MLSIARQLQLTSSSVAPMLNFDDPTSSSSLLSLVWSSSSSSLFFGRCTFSPENSYSASQSLDSTSLGRCCLETASAAAVAVGGGDGAHAISVCMCACASSVGQRRRRRSSSCRRVSLSLPAPSDDPSSLFTLRGNINNVGRLWWRRGRRGREGGGSFGSGSSVVLYASERAVW